MNTVRFIRFSFKIFFLVLFFFIFSGSIKAIETTTQYFLLVPSKPYVDTGLDFLVGSYLDIRQSGTTSLVIPGSTVSFISPAGDPGCIAGINWTLPGVRCWSLVARIGSGTPFLVGSGFGNYVLQTGRLYLGINHQLPFVGSGSWTIRVIRNQTPPPPPPTPFLDTPWDFGQATMSAEMQKKEFANRSLQMTSFFDHEYPLLSTNLIEPIDTRGSVTFFRGINDVDISYSSHDGYDWGRLSGAKFKTPVRAAAPGCAKFKNDCAACGKAITIDHSNFYQTRYYHLYNEDLITTSTTQCTQVTQGQQIGRVGFSGNVIPRGEGGAHLHFMVIEDKDRDGDFEDNIPDGLTDPFGWQSTELDPWPNYSFLYQGETKVGNDSHYLWLYPIPNLNPDLPTNGGFITFENTTINFPPNSAQEPLKLFLQKAPSVVILDALESVGSTLVVTAKNLFGTSITQFNQLFTLTFDFSDQDLSRIDPETLQIYSSSDGVQWTPEITTVDRENKKASTQLNHLTQFALVGERIDTEAPVSSIELSGVGDGMEFGSTVSAVLSSVDNYAGVDFTLYRLSEADEWQEYKEPIIFSNEGSHSIFYYSTDNHENAEVAQTKTFTISFPIPTPTPSPLPSPSPSPLIYPEAQITFDLQSLAFMIDGIGNGITKQIQALPRQFLQTTFTNDIGNQIRLTTREVITTRENLRFRIESFGYNPSLATSASGVLVYKDRENEAGEIVRHIINWQDNLGTSVSARFNPLRNQTRIIEWLPDGSKFTQILPGMKMLKINTNRGDLNYSF